MRAAVIRRTRARTLFADLRAVAVDPLVEKERGSGWPLTRWQGDPVGFAREVLGAFVMPRQVEILESARDNDKTAVRSGQKSGKTDSLVKLALWFFCCFDNARVIMTANTKDQLRNVVWKGLREALRDSLTRIDGRWSDNPSTGFRAVDGREIYGITAREIESIGGISGGAMLILADEASAIEQAKAEALEGNRAGEGFQRMVWFCNPTRSEGPMFEAFHSRKHAWNGIHINCETVADWHEGAQSEIAAWQEKRGFKVTGYLPGVVGHSRIRQWREEYERSTVFYTVRVLGDFLLNEAGKAISLHLITQGQLIWPETPEEGELSIGLDPAGPGEGGDDTCFAIVRGKKLVALFVFNALTEDAIIEHLLAFLRTYRRPEDTPQVKIDSEGPIGSALYYRIRAIVQGIKEPGKRFGVHGVRASLPIKSYPQVYERTRDALVANLARWLSDGGAIPQDHKLEEELHAADWVGIPGRGTVRLTSKDDIRAKLQRSPDRRDALALAVWRPAVAVVDVPPPGPAQEPKADDFYQVPNGFDQQAGADPWWPSD